jgi:hypothetical protein
MKIVKAYVLATSAVALAVASPASAAITDFTGFDDGWSTAGAAGPLSGAAQSSFIAAAAPVTQIDFANPLPSGVSLSINNPYGPSAVTNAPTSYCGFALCGGNVTSSNGYFLYQYGGSATFTFATPVSNFGAYFSGVQVGDSITWTDGNGSQSLTIPTDYYNGGLAFAGFTDPGQSITSITINSPGDIIGVDGVLFSASAAPGPVPGAGLAGLAALALAGLYTRTRRA